MKAVGVIGVLLIGMLIWLPLKLNGQNLVPNPSFEQFNACPGSFGRILYPPNPPANPYPTVTDWSNPVNSSTPDYLNACAPISSMVSVPFNGFGNTMARTGNAYAGIYAIEERSDGNYREYIMAQLTQPLQAGRKYYVSFFVHRAGMDTRSGAASWYSNENISTTDDIGAYISQRRVDEPQYRPLSYTPQVRNPVGNYIDTVWTKVEGVIEAVGGERFITIGNFNPINNYTTVAIRNPSDNSVPVCYFYIDDVCIVDITDSLRSQRIRKCEGDGGLGLEAPAGRSYKWNTGDTTRRITVTDTGVYWVSSAGECAFITDTFIVYRETIPVPQLGSDTSYCFGTEVWLKVGNVYSEYRWNTGSTDAEILVKASGTYILTVSDGCETASDTIQINFHPKVDLPHVEDVLLCQGVAPTDWPFDTANLVWYQDKSGGIAGSPPVLNTTEERSEIYWVSSKVGACESERVSFEVHVEGMPKAVDFNDTTICLGDRLELSAGDERYTYIWHNGASSCCVSLKDAGVYYVDISNRCGTVRSEAELTTLPCEDCVWLPNAFSPGGDGKNDLFRAVLRCPVQSFEMKIFNRWGQIIFQTINPNEGWDGNYLGAQQPVGVYYYYIKSQTGVGSEVIENALKGEIHLLR